jgi:glutamate synthase domain-containing protein 3
VQVGLIASEKQAIDATLLSLSKDDIRICPVADRYWNARGGSHTDGGAFIFNLTPDQSGRLRMTCTDKFGKPVALPQGASPYDFASESYLKHELGGEIERKINELAQSDAAALYRYLRDRMGDWEYDDVRAACRLIVDNAKSTNTIGIAIKALTMLNDLRYGVGTKKRSHLLHLLRGELDRLLKGLPRLDGGQESPGIEYRLLDFASRGALRAPLPGETTLVIHAFGFPPEGEKSDASLLMDAYMKGWRRFLSFGCIGQRYIGNGLGPGSDDVTVDVYGSSGDYLASGIDGMTIAVHGNAQDQLGQIIKGGKLVIYGDVGQTFLYGAKGGEIYVMGNAAGRPLINSVGKPRVVINGTCLDFLGESFMAGDPHNGGGFVVLNGVKFGDDGSLVLMDEPYPGSNIFSLASGGAIYIRDPGRTLVDQQLNGGMILPLTKKDWELILPYLEENERLFDIKIDSLLTVNGETQRPQDVYRKVVPFIAGKVAEELEDDLLEEEFLEEEPLMEAGVTGPIDRGVTRPENPDFPDNPEE